MSGLSAAKRAAFLKALSETASVSAACERAGVSRRTVYTCREADPAFAEKWEKAETMGLDALEDEAIRRGFEGNDKPVWQSRQLVGHIREYSDRMLLAVLKARRPERFIEGGSPSETNRAVVYLPENGRQETNGENSKGYTK